jgi:hypothetical protein
MDEIFFKKIGEYSDLVYFCYPKEQAIIINTEMSNQKFEQ